MITLPAAWAYLLAASCGAAGWVIVSLVSGRREAWDSALYFPLFLPVLCLMVAVIGFFAPTRPWRWGLVPFVAQAVIMIVQNPSGKHDRASTRS